MNAEYDKERCAYVCPRCKRHYTSEGWCQRHIRECTTQAPLRLTKPKKRTLTIVPPDHRWHFIKCSCGFETGRYHSKKYAERHYSAHTKAQVVPDEHTASYRTCSLIDYEESMRVMSDKIKAGRYRPAV